MTLVLAIGCGLSAANLYYAQPLLDVLAAAFGVDEAAVALVVTVTQLGYAAGLILIVPLGDRFETRRLATRVLVLTALALATASAAPGLGVFLAAGVAIGATSVVAQILVPLAAAAAALGGRHLTLLALAAVLLDAAVQFTFVTGQQALYASRPDARSRMNTVYIASFFLGGAAGSAVAGVLYAAHGWSGIAVLGAALPALSTLAWAWHTGRDRRSQ